MTPSWYTTEFQKRLTRLSLRLRRGREPLLGEHRGIRRGGRQEFLSHRPYVPGDDTRLLDWNVFGRLDQLHIKTFAEERQYRLTLLLDNSRSMHADSPPASGGWNKFDTAAMAATVFAHLAFQQGNRVSLFVDSDRPSAERTTASASAGMSPLVDSHGRQGLQPYLRELARPLAPSAEPFGAVLGRLLDVRGLGGMVVLVTDGYDLERMAPALRRLSAHPVTLLTVLVHTPKEYHPRLAGPTHLRDSEQLDAGMNFFPEASWLGAYQRAFDDFLREWQNLARSLGMAVVPLRTDAEIVESLRIGAGRQGILI